MNNYSTRSLVCRLDPAARDCVVQNHPTNHQQPQASILTPESNAWSLSTSSTEREIRTNRTMSLDRATTAYKTERHHSSCSELVDRTPFLRHGVPAPLNSTSWGMGDVGIKIIPRPAQSGWITRQHKKNRSSMPPPPPVQPVPLQKHHHHHHHRLQQLHKQEQLLHLRQQLHQQQLASIDMMRGHAHSHPLPIREVKAEEAIKTGYHHEQPAPRETSQKLLPPEPPLPEEICCGSYHRLPVLDEDVSLTPQQDVSHPDVSYPVKDRTPRECTGQQVEKELLLASGVKNRLAADDTDADAARHAADAYAAEDTTDGAGATVFSRRPDWPSVRKATPRKGNIISDDRQHHSGGDRDSPRKKKVSFRFVLEVYLIPRVTDYSKRCVERSRVSRLSRA